MEFEFDVTWKMSAKVRVDAPDLDLALVKLDFMELSDMHGRYVDESFTANVVKEEDEI